MEEAAKRMSRRPEFIGVTTPWSPTPTIYHRTDWSSVWYVVGSWGMLSIGVIALVTLCSRLVLGINRRLRTQSGRCERCNYDRSGLAVGTACPECGRVPAPTPTK